MLNFIATDLQLYKIFKITQVSFFGTQCIVTRQIRHYIQLILTHQRVTVWQPWRSLCCLCSCFLFFPSWFPDFMVTFCRCVIVHVRNVTEPAETTSVGCGFYRLKSVRCGCGFVGARSKYNLIP